MMDILEVSRIINGSKQYEFEGSVLTITGYYTGKKVKLDLSLLTEEMLEQLTPHPECIIIRTEEGTYAVVDRDYDGGTYYDGDSYDECLEWAEDNDIEIDEEDFRDYYEDEE